MPQINLSILNQKGTPAFFADTLANRPAAGFVGRIFVSTDTLDLYRDTGSAWVLLSPSSTGTIGGSGTTDTVPLFSSSSSITNSVITQQTGAQSVTIGSFATPFNVIGYGNYYGSQFIINGGLATQILAANGSTITAGTGISISAGQISATATGITGTGSAGQVSYWNGASSITGTNNFFWDSVNNHLGINTNTPGTALDIHHNQSTLVQLNQTTATNDTRIAFQNSGTALWRIGNFYNAGENDWAIFDVVGAAQPFTIKNTTGQTFIGAETSSSGRLVVNNATGDNHIVVLGANSPSIRVRNNGSTPFYQFGLGLSTAPNNFIQGSFIGDFCIFNNSLIGTKQILFGIYNTGSGNTEEAVRIAQSKNVLIGTTTDNGNKLQVFGTNHFSVGTNAISDIFTLRNNNATDSGVRQLFQNGFGNLASIQVKQTNNGGGANDGILELQTATNSTLSTKMSINDLGIVNMQVTPTYASNALAIAGGLVAGDIYRSAVGALSIVF